MRIVRSLLRLLAVTFIGATLTGCANSEASQNPQQGEMLPPKESAKLNSRVAQEFEEAGRYKDAIERYEIARTEDPRNYQWVAHRLGVLYDMTGEVYRAQDEYEKAYRLDPSNAELANDIGYFHYTYGRYRMAEEYLRKAIDLDSKLDRAWINLGLTLGRLHRYDDAYDAYVNVVTPAEARANIGVSMAQNGDYDGAKREIQRAIRQQPDLYRYNEILDTIRAEEDSSG